MARSNPSQDSPAKPKRKVRSLDERIAELQAKADEKKAKARAKAEAEIEGIEAAIAKTTGKLVQLREQRAAARAALGLEDDADEGDLPTRPPVAEGELAEAADHPQS